MKHLILTLTTILIGVVGYSQQLPQISHIDNQIIKHKAYTLSYNETCEQANWVSYMVTKVDLDNSVAERKNNFTEDKSVPTGSATLEDYKGSGYDRGHLAPAATFVDSQEEMDESFFMSNMSPQEPSFNRGIWKKIEEYERDEAKQRDTVYVITGGILKGNLKTIGENKVCVPEYYYKIIYKDDFIVSFYIKNEKSNEPLYMFKQPLDVIEKEVGINFMIR